MSPVDAASSGSRNEMFVRLFTSEMEYCDLLTQFRDHYCKPIKDDSKLAKPLYFPRLEYQKMVVFLSNVDTICRLNFEFRDDLKSRGVDGVGSVLEQYAPLFRMYGNYASDLNLAMECVQTQLEQNDKFAKFLLQKEETTNMSMKTMMRKPLERIILYPMFSSMLVRASTQNNNNDNDLSLLESASEEFSQTSKFVLVQQEATEKLERFKVILHREWTGLPSNLMSSSRAFLFEGDLTKLSRKVTVKYRFLLFTDQLVYGQHATAGDKIKFKRSFPLSGLVIQDDAADESFCILTSVKSFKVQAESINMKLKWVLSINQAIDVLKQDGKYVSRTLKPVMVADTESNQCMKCPRKFTLFYRRHHCRACGALVCEKCSLQRVRLTTDLSKPKVRVCEECAAKPVEELMKLTLQLGRGGVDEDEEEEEVDTSDEEVSAGRGSNSSGLLHRESTGSDFTDELLATPPALVCMCVLAHQPATGAVSATTREHELVLEIGDEVRVDECAQGWATGTNVRTAQFGSFPAHCVKHDGGYLNDFGAAARPSSSEPQRGRSASRAGGSTVSMLRMPERRRSSSSAQDSPGGHNSPLPRKSIVGDLPPVVERKSLQPLLTFTDKRSLIMNEIVVTERSYIGALRTLLQVFVRPLIADFKTGKPQLGGTVLTQVNKEDGTSMSVFFSRLEQIELLNSTFLNELENKLQSWTQAGDSGLAPACTVGDVFLRFAKLFSMYDEFSSSYEFASKTLVDREKSDAKLSKFFEDQQIQHESQLRNVSLLSLLITPIQRVPRYLLLLKEMQKNTDEKHPDFALIGSAIDTVSKAANHINEHIRERENLVHLREVDREFPNERITSENASRMFIYRGTLTKQSRKGNERYHFILFSDMLLYQNLSRKHSAVVNAKPPKRIMLETMNVQDVEGMPEAFDIVSNSKSFRVVADDAGEKNKWTKHFGEALEQMGVKAPKKAAPVWKQDTANCEICAEKFTFVFRRHHCRACGKCICGDCSKNRMSVPYLEDGKSVRVCNECFAIKEDSRQLEEIVKRNMQKFGGGMPASPAAAVTAAPATRTGFFMRRASSASAPPPQANQVTPMMQAAAAAAAKEMPPTAAPTAKRAQLDAMLAAPNMAEIQQRAALRQARQADEREEMPSKRAAPVVVAAPVARVAPPTQPPPPMKKPNGEFMPRPPIQPRPESVEAAVDPKDLLPVKVVVHPAPVPPKPIDRPVEQVERPVSSASGGAPRARSPPPGEEPPRFRRPSGLGQPPPSSSVRRPSTLGAELPTTRRASTLTEQQQPEVVAAVEPPTPLARPPSFTLGSSDVARSRSESTNSTSSATYTLADSPKRRSSHSAKTPLLNLASSNAAAVAGEQKRSSLTGVPQSLPRIPSFTTGGSSNNVIATGEQKRSSSSLSAPPPTLPKTPSFTMGSASAEQKRSSSSLSAAPPLSKTSSFTLGSNTTAATTEQKRSSSSLSTETLPKRASFTQGSDSRPVSVALELPVVKETALPVDTVVDEPVVDTVADESVIDTVVDESAVEQAIRPLDNEQLVVDATPTLLPQDCEEKADYVEPVVQCEPKLQESIPTKDTIVEEPKSATRKPPTPPTLPPRPAAAAAVVEKPPLVPNKVPPSVRASQPAATQPPALPARKLSLVPPPKPPASSSTTTPPPVRASVDEPTTKVDTPIKRRPSVSSLKPPPVPANRPPSLLRDAVSPEALQREMQKLLDEDIL